MRDKRWKNRYRSAESKTIIRIVDCGSPLISLVAHKTFLITVILVATAIFSSCSQDTIRRTDIALDTVCTIAINGDDEILDGAFDLIFELEKQLDWRLPTSDIYLLNNCNSEWVSLSPTTYEVLEIGRKLSQVSAGVFDITCLALTRLYDFKQGYAPSKDELESALGYIGWQYLELNEGHGRITKSGVGVDLGGIAKGFVADKVNEYLLAHGVTSGLVDLGGNVTTIGKKRIGVQVPFKPRGEYENVVELENEAIATSGTYERRFEKDGTIYHHVLDLNTGLPIQGRDSATVTAKTAVVADVYSTIFLITGKTEKGAEFGVISEVEIK